MYNKVVIIGNLTKDPELRYTTNGTPVCSVRLASTTKQKGKNGVVEETLFISASIFGKQGETTSQYMSKGSAILVEGRLRENKWEQDGQTKSRMEIIAQNVKFMPKRGEKEISAATTDMNDFAPVEVTDLEPF